MMIEKDKDDDAEEEEEEEGTYLDILFAYTSIDSKGEEALAVAETALVDAVAGDDFFILISMTGLLSDKGSGRSFSVFGLNDDNDDDDDISSVCFFFNACL